MKIKVGIGVLILPFFLFFSGTEITSLLVFLSAVVVHEAGHVLCAVLLKRKITEVKIEPFGARISLGEDISYGQEFLIALSGPAASFLLFLVMRRGSIADVSLFLGLINLLPVATLDGGRATECAVSFFFDPQTAAQVINVCGKLCAIAIWLISVYLVLRYDGGFGLLVFSCFLVFMSAKK